jgi:branched-subunit amino acid ABC-type transport system permease component
MFLPTYRAWVLTASIGICLFTWWGIERTRLGSYLRAATENPMLVRAFGIRVPRMITMTYVGGVMLAAFAGVLAAPIYQVSSIMGSNIIPVVFAVVVIGGLGSIFGAVVTGFMVGLLEGMTKLVYPQASNTAVFFVMIIILLLKPQGLFGKRNY